MSPQELKTRATDAHTAYSQSFAARESAETAFAEVARKLESLRVAGNDAVDKLASHYAGALADAIESPATAANSVTALGPLRDAVNLLRDAENHFNAYSVADAKRHVLVARVEELSARVTAETARRDYHESALSEALRAATELEGGLTVQIAGGVSDRLAEHIGTLSGELSRARAALAQHDEQTTAARAALEERQ